jgi:hypothetical protein
MPRELLVRAFTVRAGKVPLLFTLLVLAGCGGGGGSSTNSGGTTPNNTAPTGVVVSWNNRALQSIRDAHPGPTIVARALAITHTCMFDAWAAYDSQAVATILGSSLRRPAGESTQANKAKAMSFAAYHCLLDLFPGDLQKYNALMTSLGYDPSDTSTDPSTPVGIGNRVATSVINFRHHDGSNQLGDLRTGFYSDYTGYVPLNTINTVNNPDHWQPLLVPDDDGVIAPQRFTTPQWGQVIPFALTSGAQLRPAAPIANATDPTGYSAQATELITISAQLTDEQKVIAEYWADGPSSETPPGHWCLFAQFVSARDHHTDDDDVKMFFALGNALLDASIAAWDSKRVYDSVRPITAIHFLFAGQSIQAWAGPFLGTRAIDGGTWQPYQPLAVVTPPFPEYISGHSTFSAAAARILFHFTGSDTFNDSATIGAGSSKVEPGTTPHQAVTLSWATFSAAADEAGISRRYGGIHFAAGDLAGRAVGKQVGDLVWTKALTFINGK